MSHQQGTSLSLSPPGPHSFAFLLPVPPSLPLVSSGVGVCANLDFNLPPPPGSESDIRSDRSCSLKLSWA